MALALEAAPGGRPAPITIDYPAEDSIFPPEIAPPTFLWRDSVKSADLWRIEISFADGSASIRALSRGARMRTGRIDPECIAPSNQLPRLTPQQAAWRTWIPERSVWERIKKHSAGAPATVTISGFDGASRERAVSRGRVKTRTSQDPAGAPIFFRDVPLMPTETEKGRIKPLAPRALPLVKWRLRYIGEPQSRVVMEDLPTCANCHSFSADGKTLGMDLDGLQNNKGVYMLAPVAPETRIAKENLIQWKSAGGRLKDSVRVGFMSQVSPDGQFVATTTNGGRPGNYYVTNFKDYRFLQVFYPTRGILSWYSRATGLLQPLPGADDPQYVQMGAVWSPDGKYLVFARAAAKDPYPSGAPVAEFANDPNERQIRYDLYRIPFNAGRGGVAEPIAGASHNGMSNTFPKVSPDGKWIVFVECRNGQLMRPDSQLYIVPSAGGQARRMRANTALMNSWHSFSPNGRWLVFSSKSRSPYTQMYLTHIDSEGNDSPAILIENATTANRAVNLPEFVNVGPEGLRQIGGPSIEYFRLFNSALYLQKHKRLDESAARWKQVLEISPDDALAHSNRAMVLMLTGRREEAALHFRKASELKLRAAVLSNPDNARAHSGLGVLLLDSGRLDEAIAEFEKAAEIEPGFAPALSNLGRALAAKGKLGDAELQLRKSLELDPRHPAAYHHLGTVLERSGRPREAVAQWRKALELDPRYAEAHDSLARALYSQGRVAEALAHWREEIQLRPNDMPALRTVAWILATCPDPSIRNGSEAVALAVRALQVSGGKDALALDILAAAYAEAGRFTDAALTARRALALAARNQACAVVLKERIALYEAKTALREPLAQSVELPASGVNPSCLGR